MLPSRPPSSGRADARDVAARQHVERTVVADQQVDGRAAQAGEGVGRLVLEVVAGDEAAAEVGEVVLTSSSALARTAIVPARPLASGAGAVSATVGATMSGAPTAAEPPSDPPPPQAASSKAQSAALGGGRSSWVMALTP